MLSPTVRAVLLTLVSSILLSATPGAEPIRLRSGLVDAASDDDGSTPTAAAPTGARALLVRVPADFNAETRAAVASTGARIEGLVGAGAAIVWAPPGAKARLAELSQVAFVAEYAPELRIDPEIAALEDGDESVYPATLHLAAHVSAATIAERLAGLGLPVRAVLEGEIAEPGATARPGRVVVTPTASELAALRETIASWPETLWLARRPRYRLLNDASVWVGQAGLEREGETPVHDAGILGEGQIVGVLDTGIDADMCFFREADGTLPPTVEGTGSVGTPDPTRRKLIIVDFLWDQEDPADIGDWDTQDHGTHVAGTIAGDNIANVGVRDAADGMAPLAQLVVQDGGYQVDDCADMPAIGCPAASLYPMFQQAYDQGARIHSNSYGDRENFEPYNIYSEGSEDADRFMWENKDFLLVFAAGNNGAGIDTVASPATAKNVLAVGATNHGSGSGSVAGFSSRGYTHDGRIKPDIMTPGSSVVSANADRDVTSNNCNTTSMSGTSMACPTAAGLATLVREYFTDGFYPSGEEQPADAIAPSAALLRAAMIASATPMENVAEAPPGRDQGWGRVLLDDVLYFRGDAKRLHVADDQASFASAADPAAETIVEVFDGSEPLRVALVWTDAPSTPAAGVNLLNDLDLVAESPTGTTYLGNVFSDGESVTGGAPDRRNNVEVLKIEDPEPGVWTIRVSAHAIPEPDQPYALVVTGRMPVGGVFLERTSLTLDDGVGGDGDGVLEPGEWVDLPLTLLNSGDTLAQNVLARVESSSPHVEIVTGETALPAIASGASQPTLAPHLRIRVARDLPCGESVPLTFSYVADGFLDSETDEFGSGHEVTIASDDFEGPTSWAHVPGESTASTGDWIVGDPDGTDYQPEDDVTPDPGTQCLFTATNTSVGVDDIDDGVVVARSGDYDLSGYPEARVRLSRWFANRDLGEDEGDYYRLHIREGAAAEDVLLEEMDSTQSAGRWTEVTFRVADFVTPGPTIQLRIAAADGPNTGNLVEAALDEIQFFAPECQLHDPPPAIVEDLLVARDDDDADLAWTRPAEDPGHGLATRYRVYRSTRVDGDFAERDLIDDPSAVLGWTDPGAATAAEGLFSWLIIAENDAGASSTTP